MAASEDRKVNIFINGKQVTNSMKAIRTEYRIATNQLNKMTRGSDLYNKKAAEVKRLKGIFQDHNKQLMTVNRGWQTVKNTALGVLGAAGITGGLVGVGRAMGNTIDIMSDFEQGGANLASILDKTRGEISLLTDDAKRLGSTTSFTASEILELQTAFAKLGLNEQEILNATEATQSLAAATGTELAEAATVAGATVRGFGLDANETQRVVDVMAKSFSSSALDMTKFSVAMGTLAPVAKNAGLSIEETTAMLGKLTDSGVEASTAGAALRNILLENAKAGRTLTEGFNEILVATDKNAKAAELYGKRGATVASILADQQKQAAALTQSLLNAGGAAERMATKQLDTLNGSLKLLSSAWEGFVLSLDDGEGAFSKVLRGSVDLLTSFLSLVTATDKVGKSTLDMRDAFVDQQKELDPLLKRYDELQAKTELNAQEQDDLQTAINEIVKIVPQAATEFDIYGNALDINMDKVIKFTEAQKDLIRELSGENIEQIGESFVDATQDIFIFTDQIEKGVRASKEYRDATGELRRELEGWEALERANDIKALDVEIRDNIQTLIKFGLTQQQIIDLFDQSGKASDRQKERFLDNLNAIFLVDEATEKETETIAENITERLDLIETLKKELKAKQAEKAFEDEDQEAKNIAIQTIQKKIKRLQELGIENEKAAKGFSLLTKAVQETTLELENQILAGNVDQDTVDKLKKQLQAVTDAEKQFKDAIGGSNDEIKERKKILDQQQSLLTQFFNEQEVLLLKGFQDQLVTEQEFSDELFEIKRDRLKDEIELLDKNFQDTSAKRKQLAQMEIAQEKSKEKKITDNKKKELEQRQRLAEEFAQLAIQALQLVAEFEKRNQDERLERSQQEADRRLRRLEANRNNEIITEKEFNQEKILLQRDLSNKEREIKLQNFQRTKQIAIVESVINGQLAAVAALKDFPYPANLVVMGIVSALGWATTALIASQQPPSFRHGTGQILEGPSHELGGIDLINSQTGVKIGEAEGDEAIIPGSTTAANPEIINALLANEGRSIKEMLTRTFSQIPQIDLASFSENVQLEHGGFFATSTGGQLGFETVKNTTGAPTFDQSSTSSTAAGSEQKLIDQIIGLRTDMNSWQTNLKVILDNEVLTEFQEDLAIIKNVNSIGP